MHIATKFRKFDIYLSRFKGAMVLFFDKRIQGLSSIPFVFPLYSIFEEGNDHKLIHFFNISIFSKNISHFLNILWFSPLYIDL